MSRIVGILLMLAAWLALWGEVSIVNVVSGVVVVALLSLVVRRTDRAYTIKPIGLIKLLGIFVWRLITSSAAVVLTVVAPTPAPRPSPGQLSCQPKRRLRGSRPNRP